MPARIYDERPLAFTHPHGGRPGLIRILAPGACSPSDEDHPEESAEGGFALIVVSVNGTGFSAIVFRLEETEAQVVIAQETWIPQDQVGKWSSWARRKGGKSL